MWNYVWKKGAREISHRFGFGVHFASLFENRNPTSRHQHKKIHTPTHTLTHKIENRKRTRRNPLLLFFFSFLVSLSLKTPWIEKAHARHLKNDVVVLNTGGKHGSEASPSAQGAGIQAWIPSFLQGRSHQALEGESRFPKFSNFHEKFELFFGGVSYSR